MNRVLNKQAVLLILVTFVLAGVSAALMAQPGFGQGRGQGPNFQRLAANLNLTAEQSEQFVAIMEAQHQKYAAVRAERRQAMQSMREAHQAETLQAVAGVLDAQQLEALKTHMEQRGPGKRGRRNAQNFGQPAPQ